MGSVELGVEVRHCCFVPGDRDGDTEVSKSREVGIVRRKGE